MNYKYESLGSFLIIEFVHPILFKCIDMQNEMLKKLFKNTEQNKTKTLNKGPTACLLYE